MLAIVEPMGKGQAEVLAPIKDVRKRQSITDKNVQKLTDCLSVMEKPLEQFLTVRVKHTNWKR